MDRLIRDGMGTSSNIRTAIVTLALSLVLLSATPMVSVKAIEAGCQRPVRTVMLAECGHSPHLDQPARTLKAMKEFVAELK